MSQHRSRPGACLAAAEGAGVALRTGAAGPNPVRAPTGSVGTIVFGHLAYELDELCSREPIIASGYRTYDAIAQEVRQLLGIEAVSK